MSEEPVIAGTRSCKQELEAGTYWWCSCGRSQKQPFCDGSHKGSSFEPLKVEIAEAGKVSWCLCKHSDKKPFCDGAHRNLPGYTKP